MNSAESVSVGLLSAVRKRRMGDKLPGMQPFSLSTCGVGGVRGIIALSGPQSRLHGVEAGLLLELANVFLIADSLVAEPVGNLMQQMAYLDF